MRIRLAILSVFLVFAALSQVTYSQDKDPYAAFAEEMPQPVGGLTAIYKSIQYPNTAREARVEGKVYALAFVNENGGVDQVKVIKGIGFGCDQAAMAAIKKCKFIPAKNNGTSIKAKLAIAIDFKLNG